MSRRILGVMLSHALHASFADSAEQRVSDRRLLRLGGRVATSDTQGGIQIHNLSRTGILVESTVAVTTGETIEVELLDGQSHRAQIVWADEGLFGCRFSRPLTQAELSAALLRSAPVVDSAPAAPQPADPLDRLREHWAVESEPRIAGETKMPVGTRLWVISGLALAGWAVPAAAAWVLW